MFDSNISIDTQVRSLMNVLDDLRKGNIQVPPFQRDFVWHQDDVKALFDSIRNNYPIGSILLWEPEQNYNWTQVKTIGGIRLPEPSGNTLYVLDGCQRLATLFGCLINPANVKLEDATFWKENFELFYDLEEDAFIYLGNRAKKPHQIPLYVLTSTSEFRQYTRRYLDSANLDEQTINLYLDRADMFSRSLMDYKLAVIEVNNAELEHAVEIFSRINSKGTDITYDWIVNALSYNYNNGFRFATEIENLLVRLEKYNFGDYSRNSIFRCYQSAFDDKLYIDQQNLAELAKRKDFEPVVKRTGACIEKAVDFLFYRLHVVDTRLLPYNMQLVFLMTFFRKIGAPSDDQLKIMEKWFWQTTYSNYFTIYSLSNQRKSYRHFLNFLEGKEDSPLYLDDSSKQPFKTYSFPKLVYLSSVRSKAVVLFQLRFYCSKKGNGYGEKLRYCKIDNSVENTPANLIPFLSPDTDEALLKYDKELVVDDRSPFVIPEGTFQMRTQEDRNLFLEKRLIFLQESEAGFVRELGLEYTFES